MRINEDYIEDIQQNDLTVQDTLPEAVFASEDDCDIKLFFCHSLAFGNISWPAYRRFFKKVLRYLENNRHIVRFSEPKIRTVS